jgi:hypothetical protein
MAGTFDASVVEVLEVLEGGEVATLLGSSSRTVSFAPFAVA